jgi:hypothetical protein
VLEGGDRLLAGTWLLLGTLVIAAACSSFGNKQDKLSNVAITERGADTGGGFCKDFAMTPAQVSAFFGRAQPVDAPTLHDKFDHLPCYIRGTAAWEGQLAAWEIRAGGTGTLVVKGGTAQLYGCSTCDDLFGQVKQ